MGRRGPALGAAPGGAVQPGRARRPGHHRGTDQGGAALCAEDVAAKGWRAALADVDEGMADLVLVPSAERLGFGKQPRRPGSPGDAGCGAPPPDRPGPPGRPPVR